MAPPHLSTSPMSLDLEGERYDPNKRGSEMNFQDLGEPIVHIILLKLDSEDLARVACANSILRDYAYDEAFWSSHCSQDLGMSSPVDPVGNTLPSFRKAYEEWRISFSDYHWPLVKRVCKFWDKLKNWLRINHPDVANTLRRGVTEEDLNDFENSLGVRLPSPSRVLYRFCDGQELQEDRLWGLIGGYSVYYHLVNVYLLPLSDVRRETEELRREKGLTLSSEHLVVAQSPFDVKKFFLNYNSGELSVGTAKFHEAGEMMPCVPSTLLNLKHSPDKNEVQDGLLLWLEEHGRRLESGVIGVHWDGNLKIWLKELKEDKRSNSISQFPKQPLMCSTSVTFGVQVHASGVFMPEMSHLDADEYMFANSIRMSLLPGGCTARGTNYNSCQLDRTHWVIRENDTVVNDVSTDAAIYPLLVAGEREFAYKSFSALESVPASIEGSLQFIPGSRQAPEGDSFEAVVERFPLEPPDYIF